MHQADLISSGERNYTRLVGHNGPLVYPAGHAWIHFALHQLTDAGSDSIMAQQLAMVAYLLNLVLVFRILLRTEMVPPYILILLSIGATRARTLAVVHLFNDPIAVLFFNAAVNLYLDHIWTLGSVFFSLGVSVKMNILLYSPALLAIFISHLGVAGAVIQIAICAAVQFILAAPFLSHDPGAYLSGAFNFSRTFMHRETVNWGFLSKAFFLLQHFHLFLLAVHIGSLGFMAFCCWPTLLQKITSELVAALRFGERWNREQEGEKIERGEKKEKVDKLTLVQLTCLALVGRLPACLLGKREALVEKKEAKESGAACSKAEREKEGRSKSGSFKGKADDIVGWESSWQLWVAFLGVVAVLASAIVALPPLHPLLLHTLFWPSLALLLSYPVILISNLLNFQVFKLCEEEKRAFSPKAKATNRILLPLFFANFAGVVCARSLHAQFYSWYFYSLHYLLAHTNFATKFKLLLLSNIEATFFTSEIKTVFGFIFHFGTDQWQHFEAWALSLCQDYKSLERDSKGFEIELSGEVPNQCRRGTSASSALLQIAHWTILLNLLWVLWWKSSADQEFEEEHMREEEKLSKDHDIKEEKGSKDLEKLEKNDETAATALMG